ncbi:hypothetical protein [Hymenobacter crusticola]|uniref:Uncharacterized protein n=1 Tax=Hymenobacter crusticola TaxID=1770526 RepID=A0A243W5D9_9BACT|nr:hypothetical protein [Hymenobacter crusticola]OUJ68407.1 hypothetical protein BXP70_27905 [Hymenobacter crusticola]
MEPVPATLSIAFALTTALAIWLFYQPARPARRTRYVLGTWLLLQSALSLNGFYAAAPWALPPRLSLALAPPLVLLITACVTVSGRRYLDRLRLDQLTLLHSVRLPVELVLLGLFRHGLAPELLTFEGRNWDIVAGVSAPLLYYGVFRRHWLGTTGLRGWNVVCLGLLLNVVGNAILSVPSPFQQLAFEQPLVAVLYFPFLWLPACVVPLVLLAHVAAIRQLVRRPATNLVRTHRTNVHEQ